MGIILRRRDCYRDGWTGSVHCDDGNTWYDWGRWVAFAVIVAAALIIFFLLACVNARRRRRRGLPPHVGTSWMAPPPGPPPPNQPYYGDVYYPPQPPPQYSPPNPQSYGYFGGQPNGIELQPPPNAYHQAGPGQPAYSPPPGPPQAGKT
ncbi:uncharacterized protein ACHE_80615A [Aspergillus chevalieri]|uniref:Chitin synthesis regulation, resistance to congo red-domain-containing protein n=1 Tax=Aspergillus chevalieri TaxID=182096 RepID=A0A7R7VXV0_ASPCH|nr:uncharacterized protein ACHE_80615A [Aspergillus chevalieri]BCR92715.1 hypothetical protein ACHE_80615A [Aspergillus chevalieri]